MIPLVPTFDDCVRLEALLAREYGAKVVDKSTDPVAKAVGSILDGLGIMKAQVFAENFATTIPTLSSPALSSLLVDLGHSEHFELLDAAIEEASGTANSIIMIPPAWGPEARFLVLIHEGTHAHQIVRDGKITFASKYLLSSAERAVRYEGPAYGTYAEVAVIRSQVPPTSADLASNLIAYLCSAEEIAAAALVIDSVSASAKLGVHSPVVGKVMEEWL